MATLQLWSITTLLLVSKTIRQRHRCVSDFRATFDSTVVAADWYYSTQLQWNRA